MSDGINWLDAQSNCAVWGGDLTSIATERENNLIYTLISETNNNYWIGLFDRDGHDILEWSDRTELIYTNWRVGQPHGLGEDYVYMNLEDGKWIDIYSETNLYGYICKRIAIHIAGKL